MAVISWTLTNPPAGAQFWDIFFIFDTGSPHGQLSGGVNETLDYNIADGSSGSWLFNVEGEQFTFPTSGFTTIAGDGQFTVNWATKQVSETGGGGGGGSGGDFFSDPFKVLLLGGGLAAGIVVVGMMRKN